VEPGATSGLGLHVLEARVYYDATSGDVIHVHRLAVESDNDADENLRQGVETFDQWLRSQHDGELDFLVVSETDIPEKGPILVDINSRTLTRGQ
jgi:hypothetical protein